MGKYTREKQFTYLVKMREIMKRPLISIITVVYNTASTLRFTIESVLQQNKELIEYIIIDGGSTDGSKELIQEYATSLAYWISEPDLGIYDAMNKGINKANGNWLYFIGGDDRLMPDIINEIYPKLDKNLSIVFGDVLFSNGHVMRSFLGPRTIFQNTVHHQSAFYNSSLFNSYRYDTTIKIVSEYELHLSIYTKGYLYRYIPNQIALCTIGGASSQLSQSLLETNQIRSKFINIRWKQNLLSWLLSIYYAQKSLRRYLYGHQV